MISQSRLWHEVVARYLRMENYSERLECKQFDSAKRIVVICTDRIGDTFNCIYFLHNLKLLLPDTHTTFVGRSFGDGDLLKSIIAQYVDCTMFYEDLSEAQFKALRPDVIFNLNPVSELFQYRSTALQIGHPRECEIAVPLRRTNCKANEHLNILRVMGKRIELSYPPIRIRELQPDAPVGPNMPYIVVCPEASARSWMMRDEVAAGLIEYLLRTTDRMIVLLGNDMGGHGCRYSFRNPRVHDLTKGSSLDDAFRLIKYAECVIAVDTGLMHAASYFGTPVLAVFTCGNSARSGPQGQWGRALTVRIQIDPPSERWEKSDSKQTGLERQYLRLEHVVEGFQSLLASKANRVLDRVVETVEGLHM